jgi:parallel beta-helix repeat protein
MKITQRNPFRIAAWCAAFLPWLALRGQFLVTNTGDSGPGSLRQAMQDAGTTPAAVSIGFHIPKADPGFNADRGVWTIRPLSALPRITCAAIQFKGETQSGFIGEDTNPLGPEIEIDGSLAGDYASGLHVAGSMTADFYLLIVNRFDRTGILVEDAGSGYIAGCYIGTDPTGMERAGNGYGVTLDSCRYFNVTSFDSVRTVISGNENYGLGLVYGSCLNHVYGTFIGLNRAGTDTIGNGNYGGIRISDRSDSNLVLNNVISGNRFGVYLFNASGNSITENVIGGPPAVPTGTWSGGGNRLGGLVLAAFDAEVTEHNLVDENAISGNGGFGVRIVGAGSRYNHINENTIFANGNGAVNLEDGANEGIAPPVLQGFDGETLVGTAAPLSFVQVFTDVDGQAGVYLDYTGTDEQGRFRMSMSGRSLLANFTALVTDAAGNSSSLSRPMAAVSGMETRGFLPSEFGLEPVYPNPFNPTGTVLFSVDRPCRVRLTVFDLLGRTVSVLADGPIKAGIHALPIDASAWVSGSYFVRLEAEGSGRTAARRFSVVK